MALSDFTKMLLWQSALQIPGMVLGAKGEGDQGAVSNEISQYNAQTGRLNALANYQAQGLQPYAQALGSIGSPLAHAQERADFAKRRSFLFDGPDGGPQWVKPQGYMANYVPQLPRFDSAKPFYTDEAMLASEMPYWQSMSALTGGKVAPGFQAAGYKSQPASMAQYALNQSLSQDAYEKGLRDSQVQGLIGPSNSSAALQQALNANQEKKKTPWWKKALGIAGTIGSMFIPGGGVAMGLLRTGLGAASGALAGGKKGALIGGALGGVSSLPIPGIRNIPGIGSGAAAKGMTGLKNLATGNFLGTMPEGPPVSAASFVGPPVEASNYYQTFGQSLPGSPLSFGQIAGGPSPTQDYQSLYNSYKNMTGAFNPGWGDTGFAPGPMTGPMTSPANPFMPQAASSGMGAGLVDPRTPEQQATDFFNTIFNGPISQRLLANKYPWLRMIGTGGMPPQFASGLINMLPSGGSLEQNLARLQQAQAAARRYTTDPIANYFKGVWGKMGPPKTRYRPTRQVGVK